MLSMIELLISIIIVFLKNDNRYMKVTLKSKLIGVIRSLISINYCIFQTYI